MTFTNGYDFDGVIYMGEGPGIMPFPGSVIITGRSFEESEETMEYLRKYHMPVSRGDIYFSPWKFIEKTRERSGHHKIDTIKKLHMKNKNLRLFYEDDPIQYNIIKFGLIKYNIPTKLVFVNSDEFVKLENERRN